MPPIRVDPNITTPERVVRWVRVTQRRRVNDGRALLSHAQEKKRLPSVEHNEPCDELAIERPQGQGRLRSNSLGDDARRAFDPGRNSRPAPIERGHECVADGAAQTPEGHSVSAIADTRRPATAPARPFRAASFENTRLNQDGVGMSDMGMNLQKEQRRTRRDCQARRRSSFLSPKHSGICAPRTLRARTRGTEQPCAHQSAVPDAASALLLRNTPALLLLRDGIIFCLDVWRYWRTNVLLPSPPLERANEREAVLPVVECAAATTRKEHARGN
jgi:hypothetical protein